MKVSSVVKRYVASIEDATVPFVYFIWTFIAFVTLRNFLELFSDTPSAAEIPFTAHLHFYLFYICVALTMMLLFSAATGEEVPKTARLILASYFFVLLAPILDLIISRGQGYDMAYLLPHEHGNLLRRYLTFGGSFEGGGITIGLKLEGAIVLLASFFYFRAKGASLLRSLFFLLAIYTTVFLYAIVPFVVKGFLDLWGIFEGFSDELMIKFYLIVATILLLTVVWIWDRRRFLDVLGVARPLRQLHAGLMFVCGIALAPSLAWGQDTLFDGVLVLLAIQFACLFVIVINDLQKQPSGAAGSPVYPGRGMAIGFGAMALIYAAAVRYYAAFTILLCMGLYILYAAPPWRIKRVPFMSKMPTALSSLACVVLGYAFAGEVVAAFPTVVILWFLIPFALACNVIDIKDYHVDKSAGIQTLPVFWGRKTSQWVIGLFFIVAYVTAPLAFARPRLLLPGIGVGIVQFFLIRRENYQERWVFLLYLASLVLLVIVLEVGRVAR